MQFKTRALPATTKDGFLDNTNNSHNKRGDRNNHNCHKNCDSDVICDCHNNRGGSDCAVATTKIQREI
jgi:hypothetical protein